MSFIYCDLVIILGIIVIELKYNNIKIMKKNMNFLVKAYTIAKALSKSHAISYLNSLSFILSIAILELLFLLTHFPSITFTPSIYRAQPKVHH